MDRATLIAAGWRLTTDHSASSYGIPVVVSPDGGPIGDADVVRLALDGSLAEDALGGPGELLSGSVLAGMLAAPLAEQVLAALEFLVAAHGERGTARLLRREEAGLRVTAQAVRNIRGGAGCTVRLADHILAVARGEQGQ